MWKEWIKDYFTFSRKERRAVIVLLFLVLLFALSPKIFPFLLKQDKDKPVLLNAQTEENETVKKAPQNDSITDAAYLYKPLDDRDKESSTTFKLFFFDPNNLSEEGWKKLGLSDKTIGTIQKYISKGGKFRKPEDIGKIYGLRKSDYERLLPFVRIEEVTGSSNTKAKVDGIQERENFYVEAPTKGAKFFKPVDINLADTSLFIALPGIGSKLAQRIINFRQKLGGFYSVSQIAEVYGLPDSTFQKIKSGLICETPELKKLNVNTADVNALKDHPYIKWNLANAIVENRKQNGDFNNLDDLLRIDIITPGVLKKIEPYVEFR